jgi:hypothetical protein
MNAKMRVCQEKCNLYKLCVKKANHNLLYYTDKMQNLVRVLSQLNQEREQTMIDSLNKLILFETSVDMTLKYDTKMFVRLIEEMQLKTTIPNAVEDSTPSEAKDNLSETKEPPVSSELSAIGISSKY